MKLRWGVSGPLGEGRGGDGGGRALRAAGGCRGRCAMCGSRRCPRSVLGGCHPGSLLWTLEGLRVSGAVVWRGVMVRRRSSGTGRLPLRRLRLRPGRQAMDAGRGHRIVVPSRRVRGETRDALVEPAYSEVCRRDLRGYATQERPGIQWCSAMCLPRSSSAPCGCWRPRSKRRRTRCAFSGRPAVPK